MRPSAPWMKNARKSSVDIRSIRRQISRQCCDGWSRRRISQTERQRPATASPRCAERGCHRPARTKEHIMKRLDNKVAIVTGASKGIGAGIAKAFGAEGAAVVVNYARDHEGA